MNRYAILLLFAAASVAVAWPAGASEDEASLNVVFFLVDDLGYMDVGCNNPDTFYDTPNIDALAASGLRFTNAYAACPVCSPTRASILTGRYPPRYAITDYINPGGGNQPEKWRRKTPLLPAPFALQLPHAELTLAEVFKEAGYATFFAGKWHLGGEGFLPTDQGFDINMGGLDRGGPYGGKKYFSPYGNPHLPDGPPGEHLPDRLARETVNFIESHQAEPFFAYLAFYSVHTPLMGQADLVAKYRERAEQLTPIEPAWRPERQRKTRLVQDHAVYAAMVEAMDQAVGTVLDALDRLNLGERTLVVFFSDNGGLSTSEGHPTSNEPLRAGKGWLYEGGVREPCIVRLPGVTVPGSTSDAVVCSIDFLPTIVELTNVLDGQSENRDGLSFASVLADPARAVNRDAIYWHYPHYGNQGGAPSAAVRAGTWKLIEWYEDDSVELFDLSKDVSEKHNIAADHPDVVEALRQQMHTWRDSVGARMPSRNPAGPNETSAGKEQD